MKSATFKNSPDKPKRKKIHIAVFSILLIFLLLIGVITSISGKNVKAMNRCIDNLMAEIKTHYNVTPIDTGDFSDLKLFNLLKFRIEQYNIENIGNLSVMRVNMGVMQMATAVITPMDKNLPLFSMDYMYIFSSRKSYLEFYDLVKEKDDSYQELMTALSDVRNTCSHIEDMVPSSAWYDELITVATYKSSGSKDDAALEALLIDTTRTYLEKSKSFPLLSEEERKEKYIITKEYTDGLIDRGGVSTDVFKQSLGDEETRRFFDEVFFGTAK